jgi:hypothetical protein
MFRKLTLRNSTEDAQQCHNDELSSMYLVQEDHGLVRILDFQL